MYAGGCVEGGSEVFPPRVVRGGGAFPREGMGWSRVVLLLWGVEKCCGFFWEGVKEKLVM